MNDHRCWCIFFLRLEEGQTSKQMKSIGLTLYDIPAAESTGSHLGSMVFTETFLDSRVTCQGGMIINIKSFCSQGKTLDESV